MEALGPLIVIGNFIVILSNKCWVGNSRKPQKTSETDKALMNNSLRIALRLTALIVGASFAAQMPPPKPKLSFVAEVLRLRASNNQLQLIQRFAVDNSSTHTIEEYNFQFYLPEGAHVESAMASSAGAQPGNAKPIQQEEKNMYAIVFPLRPGETGFQITSQMAYSGQATIQLKSRYGADHLMVVVPKTMKFTAGSDSPFQSMVDPQSPGDIVQVINHAQPGQIFEFRLSGFSNPGSR